MSAYTNTDRDRDEPADRHAATATTWSFAGCAARIFCIISVGWLLSAAEPDARRADPGADAIEQAYANEIQPLVVRYCAKCHSDELAEADLNLLAFKSFADAWKEPEVWQKVREMLDTGQMPPMNAKQQPTDAERAKLRDWLRRFLKEAAKRDAGDPGPVVLRRLNNAEYTYVLRDLTGVESLQPAREFPADGAAGEGFTNTGNALVMSPALVAKYLDAAKEVASHAVLTPDGMRFSAKTTRRDWTEELLEEIRAFYAQFSESAGGSQVNLQGIVFDTNGGGRLPVEKYLAATIAERDALTKGTKMMELVARERGLSPKYLSGLWKALTGDVAWLSKAEPRASSDGESRPTESRSALESQPTARPSLLLDGLRARWRTAKPEDAPALTAEIARWQAALWRFTSVGHIGKLGGPKAWMEPVSPITSRQELKMKLSAPADGKDVVLYLAAGDAGDGNEHDFVVWERPRLVAPGRPDLLLRDVRPVTRELAARRERIFASAARCLAAAAEASTIQGNVDVAPLAKKHGVEADVLAAWLDYLGIGAGGPVKIGTPLTRQIQSAAGYDFVKGWVGDEALSVVANSSDQHVRIPGNVQPHSVAVHPSPTLAVAIGWRSPIAATLQIEGLVQHAHPECGNGVVWSLELRRGNTRQRLAAGTSQGANKIRVGPIDNTAVQPGDLVSLVIGPRDGNHACDLTAIDLTLRDGVRDWNLAREVSPDILASNPHSDGRGNAEVWHFYSEPASGSTGHVIPAGSLLARWQAAPNPQERQRLADELQRLLQADAATPTKDSPDTALRQQLTSLGGPLLSAALQALAANPAQPAADSNDSGFGLDPTRFGKHPNGAAIEPGSFCVRAPSVVEIRLPGDLVSGAEFATAGALHADTGKEGSVQIQLLTTKPDSVSGLKPTAVAETNANGPWTSNNRGISHATPVLVTDGSAARKRIEAAFEEFRQLFPAALCYTKIVPVDEVVTLTLFYREDDHLQRLMLDEEQISRINRLWEEMHFISHDALTLVDAFEQLWQYATQDADPKVFEPLRKPIQDRAAAFRRLLVDAEPKQLDAVLRFASLAYRRTLTDAETRDLAGLYRSLREQELGHDEALRLLLARVFVSPAFLYRAEKSIPHTSREANRAQSDAPVATIPVSDQELATRLSFFLWSTIPDSELRTAAAAGTLRSDQELAAQAHRMLKDARVRRLATEFACQWLHIYEFDSHDEKSEAAFPTFAGLRGAMYEESIRYFTDLFQRDGSILQLLDADHTFVNEDLAKHYGIAGITGPEWRRVDGVKQLGRGGILGMATTLSKQSGASRTSPILRGNWISEVLLGEKLPKPPKGVPQLPDVVPAGLTERQLIEQHSSVPACAKCHARIDPFGFALEEFDAIGRRRGNAPGLPVIDTGGKLLDGTVITGLDGLRSYLAVTRRDDFVRQFCRKLLGYALGRAVQLSDEPLLDEMQGVLEQNGFRSSTAVETIVRSKQFRHCRSMNDLALGDQE